MNFVVIKSILLFGLEEFFFEYYVKKLKIFIEVVIQNFIRGGVDFNFMIDKGKY